MPRTGYDTDVLVAGGGPAGLASAVYAARAGFSVLVCEPRTAPVDKACGEGIMPGGVRGLAELGVRPVGMAFSGIEYADLAGRRVRASFSAGSGLGVRRTELHTALVRAAKEAGAQWSPARVTQVAQDASGVTAAGVRARWLIAADGLHSPVRRHLGIPVRRGAPARFGLRRHWQLAPWTDAVEVTWGQHAEAYVTPVGPDQVGVAVLYRRALTPPAHAPQAPDTYTALLRSFPELAERLAGAPAASAVRGAGPLCQRPQRRVQGRVLLVGDAAGYEDALTGEGVSLAVAQARAAVDALLAGAPGGYERRWRRLTRRYRLLTRGLVMATAVAPVRGLLLPCCAAAPGAFRRAVDQLAQ
ncbi:NAD(P)/FAD-dependent oxidoreductase [Streptomyces purpurogeneiscleroticus]|uniref:NAD(P)/FAD-dependent oxidoreductase n=1 Tax=Streptomyces purpurogeneiscleroticus TaxID=68259 RepID=UPI001CBDF142|nr:NAD(P)/FAD-dependent oxidoreductase [Streptomyces purpurogeneiscleroticus]MBZ4020256.1 monooxygenase [Streptomyces purpurogeneiscleroticus]